METKGLQQGGEDTPMKLIHVQIYTYFIQIHKQHIKDTELKKDVKISRMETKTQLFLPCFSPSPPPVEVQFILQFIYTYIVSMHKRIAHPNPNDRGAAVGSLFFNMGITLTHT